RPGIRYEHGRKVSAAEAVHEVVVHGKTGVLDEPRRVDDLLHGRSVTDHPGHRVEGRLGGLVQPAEQRRRLGADGETAQDLSRILVEVRGDLGRDDVARSDLAAGFDLTGDAVLRTRHGRGEEIVDEGDAAVRVVR